MGPSDVYVPIKGDKAHGVIRINGEQWNRKWYRSIGEGKKKTWGRRLKGRLDGAQILIYLNYKNLESEAGQILKDQREEKQVQPPHTSPIF